MAGNRVMCLGMRLTADKHGRRGNPFYLETDEGNNTLVMMRWARETHSYRVIKAPWSARKTSARELCTDGWMGAVCVYVATPSLSGWAFHHISPQCFSMSTTNITRSGSLSHLPAAFISHS